MGFRNRIIEFGIKAADQFTANPRNPRIHPQFQRDVMKAALDSLGWIAPVIENKRTGYLIDGHERVMQAMADNAPVPFVVVELDETEEAEALATFDPITGLAAYDAAMLKQVIDDAQIQNSTIDQMLSELQFDADLISLYAQPGDATKRDLGDKSKQVRVALYLEQVEALEKAIDATGIINRGEALTAICEFYLEQKRQLHIHAKGEPEKVHAKRR